MSDSTRPNGVPTGMGDAPAPDFSMFIWDIGYEFDLDGHDGVGVFHVSDALRVPGSPLVRISVLATVADILTGTPASRAVEPAAALTVDLTMRTYRAPAADRLDMRGTIVKLGSRILVTEATFHEPGRTDADAVVASCTLGFTASPRPQDMFRHPEKRRIPVSRPNMNRPFAEQLGARVLAPGVVEIDRYPYVMQPYGTLQGGVVALLGELAGESVLGAPITGLEVRYLSAVRVGPARTTTTRVSPTTARVEVRDAGADRTTALIYATC